MLSLRSTVRVARLVSGLTGLAAVLGVAAGTGTLHAVPQPGAAQVTGSDLTLTAAAAPTNAGKVFRWGLSQWEDEFRAPLRSDWTVNQPRLARIGIGMLTLNATPHSGTVAATVTGHARRYGRWEARVRGNQFGTGHTPYRLAWELVPAGRYHCGGNSIVLDTHRLGARHADMAVRIMPRRQFRAAFSANTETWHTFAVEVTKHRISWFVDTRVVRSERRPAALSGVKYHMRFRLVAQPGARMNPGRMQMDWVRYYTLARPNARSVKAPALSRTTYRDGC